MKLMSNDEDDKLKLNNSEAGKLKSLRKKKRTCIQRIKLIYTQFAKYVSSKNRYIWILCYQ